jgi:hypothetical protein
MANRIAVFGKGFISTNNKKWQTEKQAELNAMNRGTVYADQDMFQNGKYSYMHAMRDDGESIEDAMNNADAFVREHFAEAKRLLSEGKVQEAYYEFGIGLHTLQDATSPAHSGFQRWGDHLQKPFQLAHVLKELFYPGVHSNLQKITNQYLEWFEKSNAPLPKENLFSKIKSD